MVSVCGGSVAVEEGVEVSVLELPLALQLMHHDVDLHSTPRQSDINGRVAQTHREMINVRHQHRHRSATYQPTIEFVIIFLEERSDLECMFKIGPVGIEGNEASNVVADGVEELMLLDEGEDAAVTNGEVDA